MNLAVRLMLLSALICSPLLLLPGGHWWIYPLAAVLCLQLLARQLSKQFNQIYRLRYLEGRPEPALKLLSVWKLLLPASQYALLVGETLLQADRPQEVEKLERQGSLPAWAQAHLAFILAKKRRDWEGAEAALRRLLACQPPAGQDMAARGELACILAERFPDRHQEAQQLLSPLLATAPPGPMGLLLSGIQGIVQVAGQQQVEEGIEQLRRVCEQLGTGNVMVLPFVAEFHRWQGRGYRQLGRYAEAREEFVTARTLTRLPRLLEENDRELEELQAFL